MLCHRQALQGATMKPDMIRDMGGDDLPAHILFESERFLLTVQTFMKPRTMPGRNTLCPNPPLVYKGYELVDKTNYKELFLVDSFAVCLLNHIQGWQVDPPTESECDAVFEQFIELAYLPLIAH
jgi:hypothetical protein